MAARDHAEIQNEIRDGQIVLPPDNDFEVQLQKPTGELYQSTGRLNFFDPSVDPKTGMVMNLRDLKGIVEEQVVKKCDHKNLNVDPDFMEDVIPTAEATVDPASARSGPICPSTVPRI